MLENSWRLNEGVCGVSVSHVPLLTLEVANYLCFFIILLRNLSFLRVHTFMQDLAFKHSIQFAETREAIMGSALARFFNSSLCFVEDNERRKDYDYSLYSSRYGWCFRVEQQDDYFIRDMQSTLLIELFTYALDGKNNGKLYYTKADKFCYVINHLKKIILLDVKVIKEFIINLEHQDLLQVYEPSDHQAWRERWDTNPTCSAIIPIQEALLQDPKHRVIDFEQLNISSNYDQLQFKRQNYN